MQPSEFTEGGTGGMDPTSAAVQECTCTVFQSTILLEAG